MNKKILIIYTGGTIGMIGTENGYAPKENYFENEIKRIPELSTKGMPEWDFYEFSPLLDSSNITAENWENIAEMIYHNYDSYDGFVVLHGTDTLAYTASALSFMLEGLNKPVILTGSQIPLCMIRSDARENLLCSIIMAADGIANEVSVFFGGKLLRGNRTTKISADDLIAFDSPNYPPLATTGIKIKYNESVILNKTDEELNLTPIKPAPIGVIKFFPGMQSSLFENIMTEKLKGIVLEAFGAGNIPSYDNALPGIIQKAFKNGSIITVCSQCAQGTVSLGAYETSSPLKNAGAVSGFDMTTEAAVAKLYYLFSKGYPKEKIKELMETNIRGELTIQGGM